MNVQGFPDRVYAQAAVAFQASCVEETQVSKALWNASVSPLSDAEDNENELGTKQDELWAYELAFNTMKFQALLEDVLTDSCFQVAQHLPDDLMPLAMVMLYDLQDRKFQPREPIAEEREGHVEEVRLVEDGLYRLRTKLAASLARFRIKQDLVCIEDFLPKSVKEKHQRKPKLLTWAWVNTLKSSVDEVRVTLKTQGFLEADPRAHLEGSTFCKDTHCPDVLLFPRQARGLLDKTTLLTDHTLVIQEKSRCLAVSALSPLLAKNTDVLIAGSFSAHTVAHVGVQTSAFSSHVYACGIAADSAHRDGLQRTLSRIGCKNVRLLSDRFAELNEADSRLQKVRVVLVLPRCTASALADPVAHMIDEGGDRKLLRDLSQGAVSDSTLESLIQEQIRDLSHALTFPKVHSVVYCTCSEYAEENELVVKTVLKNAVVRTKLRPFRVVSTGWTDEKFFRLRASVTGDGCFVCVLKREEGETVQDILVRAAAKGLLNGLALPEKDKKTKTKEKQTGAPVPPPPPQPDHRVSEQLNTDTTVLGGSLEHTQDSRLPSPDQNHDPATAASVDTRDQAPGPKNRQKKGRGRKPGAPKYKRRVKAKSHTTRKGKTRTSRKKKSSVQTV